MVQTMYISNAAEVITVAGHTEKPAKKEAMSEISVVENGSVWIENGKIIAVDTNENIRKRYQDQIHSAEHIDATGKIVTPGLVDPHTHLVHRSEERREGKV